MSNLLLPPRHARAQALRAVAAATPYAAPPADSFSIPGAVLPIDEDGNRIGRATWVARADAMDIPDYVWHRIPEPSGWRVLVQEYAPPKETRGGIIMPDESLDWHSAGNYIGRVLALGPACYQHPKFQVVAGDGRALQDPWCAVGEWVTFAHYSGTPRKIMCDGEEWRFRFIFDESIEGRAPTPDGLKVYAE